MTFLWQGGACAFPPVLGSPGSLPADRSFDTLLVAVQRLGLVPRVAYTYDEDLLKPETRAMFVVAPVNTPPERTLARLKDFVRRGGCLIVMDDSRIGERGSAKDFLGLFGVSIVYHGAQGPEGHAKPHVHLAGGMEPVKIPAADAFMARKLYEQGQIVYMWDAADFSRQGLGHGFARPWKTARARYETSSDSSGMCSGSHPAIGGFMVSSERLGTSQKKRYPQAPGGTWGHAWNRSYQGIACRERAGDPIRAGSDPDQFDVVFLDIGALSRGGRGFESLDQSAEL